MKNKKLMLMLFIMLFLTGCSAEYNLTIKDNIYNENIKLIGHNKIEIENFNRKWIIPINKEEFQRNSAYESINADTIAEKYSYKLQGNNIVFNYDFKLNELIDSTAISRCYSTISLVEDDNKIFLSTSKKLQCFKNYPPLEDLTINIIVDTPVIKHNADSKNGNKYTWHLNKENESNYPINMIIENPQKKDETIDEGKVPNSNSSNIDNEGSDKHEKKDHTLYIFLFILLLLTLIGIMIIKILNNKKDDMDD